MWSLRRLTTTTVDSQTALVVDAAGRAHVAFRRDGARSGIYVATNAQGSWRSALAIAGADLQEPSLAVDADGSEHVAFVRRGSSPGIFYATNLSGRWAQSRVSDGNEDGTPKLKLGPRGAVHIAFVRYDSAPGIYVAGRNAGAWAVTKIANGVPNGAPALAIDAAGKDHLVFGHGFLARPGISYATNRSGVWKVTTLPETGLHDNIDTIDNFPAVEVDAIGIVHIAFGRLFSEEQGLYYVTNASGSWIETRVGGGRNYTRPTLSIGANGDVRIAFNCVGSELGGEHCGVYAASKPFGIWIPRRVGPADWGALAIDGTGHVHAAFNGAASGILYRTDVPGTWTTYRVTTDLADLCPAIAASGSHLAVAVQRSGAVPGAHLYTNSTGAWATGGPAVVPGALCPSLAVDQAGHAHVAMPVCEPLEGDVLPPEFRCSVVYATNATGRWTRTTITRDGDGSLALALDVQGRVHLVYGSYGTDEVRYAANRAGIWTVTTVARGVQLPSPAIAVDGAGSVHITYGAGDGPPGSANLYYLTNASHQWVRSLLARSTFAGPSMAAAPNGRIHVAFTRAATGGRALYDMTKRGGSWTTSKISSDVLEDRPALALDGDGTAHLAFVTASGGIGYATNAGGTWATSKATSNASDGPAVIAVTPDETVHIAFVRDRVGLYYGQT